MRKKRVLLLFLIVLVNVLIILTIAAYAYEYISPLPQANDNTSGSDLTTSDASTSEPILNTEETINGNGVTQAIGPVEYNGSTHPYNTWNSPYSTGVDGYNYTDPQHYEGTSTP